MKSLLLTSVLPVTFVALVVAWLAVSTINIGIYMTPADEPQLIRNRCHFRLVQPEWVSSNGSILTNWLVAETKARLAVIAILWFGAVSFMVRRESDKDEDANAK